MRQQHDLRFDVAQGTRVSMSWHVLAWLACLTVLWAGAGISAYAQDEDKEAALREADELIDKSKAYYKQGKYDEAMPLAERALVLRERHLGSGHPEVAEVLSALGAFNFARGEYERAEPLLTRALSIREKALGPNHPDSATSLNNLGVLYSVRGEYERAEPLYERALAIREKELGPEHPDVAESLDNLASLYDDLAGC